MAFGMTPFGIRNLCATLLSLIVFGLMIASSAIVWYIQGETYAGVVSTSADASIGPLLASAVTFNYTRTYFDLEQYRMETRSNVGTIVNAFFSYSDRSSTRVYSVVKTSQAFILVALITSFILFLVLLSFFSDRLRNKILFVVGMNTERLMVILAALLILVSTAIAFLQFLGITTAFAAETPNCNFGYCRSFASIVKSQSVANVSGTSYVVTLTQEWGPDAGWYIDLAAIPVSALLLVVIVLNKFPLPIDSEASSGEAL
jgi:hypothetical protein